MYPQTAVPLGCTKWSLIHEPQSPQWYTCCGIDSPTATVTLGCTCSSMAFSMGYNAFRDVPAPVGPYPQPQFLQECTCSNMALPMAAPRVECSVTGLSITTHFEVLQHDHMHSHGCFEVHLVQHALILGPQSLQGIPAWQRHNHSHRCFEMHLAWHGLIHSHRRFEVSCSHVASSTGHSPFNSGSHWSSSLCSAAAQKQQQCLGHLPDQAERHCCYQNVPRHSRVRW